MADIRCPLCSKPNPDTLTECQYCGTPLKSFDGDSIRPGDEPTKKSTAELEKALPDWLRNLRQGDEDGQPASETEKPSSPNPPAAEESSDDFLSRLSGSESQPARDMFTPAAPVTGDLLAGLAASQGDDEEIPDWLASIQGQVKAENPQGFQIPSEQSSSLGDNDWLSQLDAEEKPAKPASSEPGGWSGFMGEPETPTFFEPEEIKPVSQESDWFNTPAEEKPLEQFASESMSDTPDWLRDLEASQPSAPQQPVTTPAEQAFPSEGVPDWLRGLDSETTQEQPLSQPSTTEETLPAFGETPDWLNEFPSNQPLPQQTSVGETPDWMNELQTGAPTSGQPVEGETPDWLRDIESSQPAQAQEPLNETPDWLSDIQSGQPATEQSSIGETPDWLGDLQSNAPVTNEGFSTTGETPDWLKEFAAPGSTPEQDISFAPSQETPDWLGDMQASVPTEQGIAPATDMPDWLADLQSGQPAQQPPAGLEQPFEAEALFATPGESLPSSSDEADWLSALNEKTPAGEAPVAAQPETAFPFVDEGIPDWLAGAAAVGAGLDAIGAKREEPATPESHIFAEARDETPDWLSDMAKSQESQAPANLFADEFASQDSGSNLAESFSSDATMPAFVGEQGEGGELLGMDMPDWLSNIEATESNTAEQSLPASSAMDESLTPTELPSWVQAMRPVESIITEAEDVEEEQFVESQGPLAGMRNVLPVVTGLITVRKPAAYTSKLQVNDIQQSNATLLESMLTPKAEGVRRGQRGKSMRILRWVIALVLVVFVALPIFFGSDNMTPTANLVAPEMAAAYYIIEALPENAPVLVVFDYEPSFSGELATVATPMLDHLMLKNARLVIVSSVPTGASQAEELLNTTLSAHNYEMGIDYINLGYIPGGPAGISTFATDPTHTTSVDVRNMQVWQDPGSFIAGLGSLSDFSAMIVLTDNSDTGRIWIEQSRDALGASPMLFGISAQAEPMLRPYFDSHQVQGMVTGLAGGASYENKNGRLGLGRAYWDAYSVAFLVAEIIIVVGGVWALMAVWRTRSKQKDEA